MPNSPSYSYSLLHIKTHLKNKKFRLKAELFSILKHHFNAPPIFSTKNHTQYHQSIANARTQTLVKDI